MHDRFAGSNAPRRQENAAAHFSNPADAEKEIDMKTKPLAGKTITLPVFIHGEQASNYASEYESDSVFDGKLNKQLSELQAIEHTA